MTFRNWVAISVLFLGTIAANDVAPTNAELQAMYDKAFRAFDAANYVQALSELDTIDARKPDLAESQNLRGVIYMRQGLYDKAEAALSESQRLDPKFWNARFNLAEIPFLKKDWPEARKRFQDLLTTNASELQGEATQLIQYKILLTYLLEGNDNMVDSILAKFELSPDTPAVHYANAAISLQRQKVQEAKDWMGAAEKNFSPQLNKLFAESLFEIGWLEKTPGQQRVAIQLLSPEEREAKTKAATQSTFEQAQQAYEQRDFGSAAKLAEQADTSQPNQAAILNLRGEILLEQQKYDEAEAFFKKALKVDSKFREAQFNLADVPFRKKDYAKARDRFEELFRQTPGGDKNQAAQVIKFKIFMTYLLEQKDSRAQKMMEQFQFSGDTPALYYAQAAWEFQHGNKEKANDWVTSARKIYPLSANSAYGSGFYNLGWLATAAASPSPSAQVDAAAVASAQNESGAPAIEPSPIPGAENKADESAAKLSLAQAPSPAAVGGMDATTMPAAPAASQATVNLPQVAAGNANLTGSPARPLDVPATPNAGVSPTVERSAAVAQQSVAPSAPSVKTQASAASSTAPAPAKIQNFAQPTFADRFFAPHVLIEGVLLLAGIGIFAWMGLPWVRRRFGPAEDFGHRPATADGPKVSSIDETEDAPTSAGHHFAGGPRQVSVQLKASEPSLRRGTLPLSKRNGDTPPVADESQIHASNGNTEISEPIAVDDFDSAVGPIAEQEVPMSVEEAEESTKFAPPVAEEEFETVEPITEEETLEVGSPAFVSANESYADAEAAEPVMAEAVGKEELEPVAAELISIAHAAGAEEPAEMMAEAQTFDEPVAQGSPVPHQTVISERGEETFSAPPPAMPSFGSTVAGIGSAIAGLGALRQVGSDMPEPEEEKFSPQPTESQNMPETLQTPPAPVIRTPVGGIPPQPLHTPASGSQAAPAGGMHTAVQITLSCEIASMQLTPAFKMGALQLRPVSKVVTMRLAPSQQPQPAMNLQVNFEIAKVQPSSGSLGQVRLNPSTQQKPASLSSPSFSIAGLQIVSGSEGAPVQLTPAQQNQASVHITAAFNISTVEFSPSFDIAAIILNANSKTVSVQLPGAAGIDNAPMFEISNVQMTGSGEIGMLQLNPVGARRA